jgi:hypothetical protein
MTEGSFTKAQKRNNKEFNNRLDKVTGWLVDGDWHGSFRSLTEADGDAIIANTADRQELSLFTLEFSRLPGGGVKAVETRVEDGETRQESFIVGVQPYEKTFYMISLDDNDIAFGNICRGSNTISVSKLEGPELGDETILGIFQFTDLLA